MAAYLSKYILDLYTTSLFMTPAPGGATGWRAAVKHLMTADEDQDARI